MTQDDKATKQAFPPATISFLPWQSGDGYSWGGGCVLSVGDLAVSFGEGKLSATLAREVVHRFNEYPRLLKRLSDAVDVVEVMRAHEKPNFDHLKRHLQGLT